MSYHLGFELIDNLSKNLFWGFPNLIPNRFTIPYKKTISITEQTDTGNIISMK